MFKTTQIGIILAALAVATSTSAQTPLGTAFTYQGQLRESGLRFTGMANIDFALFDATSAGLQVESTIILSGVVVTDGVFTVVLDFGASAFDGDARWLEITVDGTTLSPRQALNGTPYAIQTRKLFVDDAGKVGIGTTAPVTKLHVLGTSGPTQLRVQAPATKSAQLALRSGINQGLLFFNSGSKNFSVNNLTTGGQLRLATQDTPRITIASDGRVGIGTTAPATKLHVLGTSGPTQLRVQAPATKDAQLALRSGINQGLLFFNSGSKNFSVNNLTASGQLRLGTQDTPRITIASDGKVGIGTTSPSVKLHVVGEIGTTAVFLTLSDRRFKQEIKPLSGSLDKVRRLRGVSYDWRRAENPELEFPEGRQVGFIAQEVKEVVPEAVSVDSDGIHSVAYSTIVPVLVESIKEQQEQIEALKAQIAELAKLMQGSKAVLSNE